MREWHCSHSPRIGRRDPSADLEAIVSGEGLRNNLFTFGPVQRLDTVIDCPMSAAVEDRGTARSGGHPLMDSSTRTGEFELDREPLSTDVTSTQVHPVMASAVRDRCAACGAAMAPDQRYCVGCGERRGASRVTLLEGPARHAGETPAQGVPSQRRAAPVNSTFISIIGLLLLAMGIGVLIGRAGNSTSIKSPPAQVVTIAGSSAGAPSSTTPVPTTTASATPTNSSSAKTGSKAAKLTLPKSTVPPPKAVKVGSPGHGRGYQNGHFTGNFFGE
jgi:hypothetical protein